jgi:hypothetical protein
MKYAKKTARQYRIRGHLLDGLGVEDIALWMDYPIKDVRSEVVALRASGELADMFGNPLVNRNR